MTKKHITSQVKKRVKGEARKRVQSRKATINEEGEEVLDEQPLFVEVGQRPEQTMDEKIRQITLQVQAEAAAKLSAQNMSDEEVQKVLDEESNFDIPDDFEDTLTVYEAQGVVSDLEEQITVKDAPITEEAAPDVSGQDEPSTSAAATPPPAEQSSEAATEAAT